MHAALLLLLLGRDRQLDVDLPHDGDLGLSLFGQSSLPPAAKPSEAHLAVLLFVDAALLFLVC